jgi:hypothetical protein
LVRNRRPGGSPAASDFRLIGRRAMDGSGSVLAGPGCRAAVGHDHDHGPVDVGLVMDERPL